jgi:type II secretory pathway pseudopilin PulG
MKTGSIISARPLAAFTMIEIAISLAVIGFALVAIIGVMPIGMNTQRDNREETIVNQDALVFASAIRNGPRGYDDLTNSVLAISNHWTDYEVTLTSTNDERSGVNWYTYTNAGGRLLQGGTFPVGFGISNGFRIVGLLTTPKYEGFDGGFRSNYITATVRAFSGLASEKSPQDNPDVAAGAFRYRLICENQPLPAFTTTNIAPSLRQLTNNLRDVRLTFRWPLTARGVPGNGRQSFRTTVAGQLVTVQDNRHPLYFFENRTFTLAP